MAYNVSDDEDEPQEDYSEYDIETLRTLLPEETLFELGIVSDF